jgi:hypothetical protein
MTLLEFAEKTTPAPLTAWQVTFLTMYEQAVKDGKELICIPGRCIGRQMIKDIVNQMHEVRCKECGKLLGKLPPDTPYEIVCSKCKTTNKQ